MEKTGRILYQRTQIRLFGDSMWLKDARDMSTPSLILVVNRALLGEVRPKIRKVAIEYEQEKQSVSLYIYYDEPLNQEEKDYDIVGTIMTEIISSFPQAVELFWNEYEIVKPYPEKIPDKGICIYKRYEPSQATPTNATVSLSSGDVLVNQEDSTISEIKEVISRDLLDQDLSDPYLMLIVNRALLGEVRPKIREISLDYQQERKEACLYIYYDEPLDQEEKDYDIVGRIIKKIISVCPKANRLTWSKRDIIKPYPERIPNKKICIYQRYEPPIDSPLSR